MEDMSPETEPLLSEAPPPDAPELPALAGILGELLHEHKGADVLTLDLRELGAWTDFFVIATASSDAHMDGMERHIKEFCRERGLEILRRSRKPPLPKKTGYGDESPAAGIRDEWRIMDLGPIVIHLMSRRARAFYDLERLYSMARAEPPGP
ncbi:MAG: RsfS/YbeB/iojap family protein [Treponema sp.]|nr:RsfS/YbeB/iojap family protein [Treponema sp.]